MRKTAYVFWDKKGEEHLKLPNEIKLVPNDFRRSKDPWSPPTVIAGDNTSEIDQIVKWMVSHPKEKIELVSHHHMSNLKEKNQYYYGDTQRDVVGADGPTIRLNNAKNAIKAILAHPAASPKMKTKISVVLGDAIKRTTIIVNRK